MDLLKPRYDSADLALLDEMRSRLAVANALLSARLGLGLSQAALAVKAGTKQSRVSEIEAMNGNPRFDTLDRISRAAGLTIALLPREMAQETTIFTSPQYTVSVVSLEQTLHVTALVYPQLDPQINYEWSGPGTTLSS
jgi:transcriptional regulator with XRE-family HTH domain